MTATDALNAVIDAQNAAIFTYGVSTAFIGSADRGTVADFIAAHRVRRDAFNADLTAAGAPERPAATGYTLPVEVTGPESAAAALLAAEEDCTRALYALLEQADTPEVRRQAVDALVECGVRAAHWRAVLGQSPVTVAFPGRPE